MTTKKMTTNGGPANGFDPYFAWLCQKVGAQKANGQSYYILLATLHTMAFQPGNRIETDKNRAQDGLELRVEFMTMHGAEGSSINRGPCSMLEFLIGISKRMSFVMCEDEMNIEEKTGHYFWKLIRNLRLLKLDDERYSVLNGDFYVQEAVDRVLLRSYDRNGDGGLFPLKGDYGDQRDVEIWYQMQFWLGEHVEIEVE